MGFQAKNPRRLSRAVRVLCGAVAMLWLSMATAWADPVTVYYLFPTPTNSFFHQTLNTPSIVVDRSVLNNTTVEQQYCTSPTSGLPGCNPTTKTNTIYCVPYPFGAADTHIGVSAANAYYGCSYNGSTSGYYLQPTGPATLAITSASLVNSGGITTFTSFSTTTTSSQTITTQNVALATNTYQTRVTGVLLGLGSVYDATIAQASGTAAFNTTIAQAQAAVTRAGAPRFVRLLAPRRIASSQSTSSSSTTADTVAGTTPTLTSRPPSGR